MVKFNGTALTAKAHEAGLAAVAACTVQPMVVARHANPLDDNSAIREARVVPDGPCGFAWVNLKPANSAFAKWLKAECGWRKSHEGGITMWVHYFNQSAQKKEAYAYAYAKVLRDAGFNAYAGSRLD